jgi:dUTP pyrophosphatase
VTDKLQVKVGISRPQIKVRAVSPRARIPSYATAGSAGLDLHACFDPDQLLRDDDGKPVLDSNNEPVRHPNINTHGQLLISAGEVAIVPTGIAMEIPEGFEGQIRPRSGLAAKYAVTVLNSPGTIDSDYRGEIKVILVNLGGDDLDIDVGERIAQLVIAPVARAELLLVDSGLSSTVRGTAGFGSTGKN